MDCLTQARSPGSGIPGAGRIRHLAPPPDHGWSLMVSRPVQGAWATAVASSRRPHVGHLANAPGAQPLHGGQQPVVILMAGFAAAQVRGHSREAAWIRARPGEFCFGVAVQYVERSTESKSTSYAQTDAALTAMKKTPELEWLNEVSSVPLQQTLRHQHKAFQAFFQWRARYPRFKSRHGRQSATYTRSAFSMRDGVLRLAKTTAPLAFVWSWPDIGPATLNPATVTVSRDPCGRWHVSFAVEVAGPGQSPATGDVAGVDLGIKDFAVTSDGEKIPNPRKLARRACALARYQRRLARCQKGSANRIKAKAKVARAHRKVRASRADFLHRASTRLVREP